MSLIVRGPGATCLVMHERHATLVRGNVSTLPIPLNWGTLPDILNAVATNRMVPPPTPGRSRLSEADVAEAVRAAVDEVGIPLRLTS